MSPNLVVTVQCPPVRNERLHDLCIPTQRKWARSIGADYMIIQKDSLGFEKNKVGRHISYNNFNVYELIEKFNRVLVIDPDMFVKPDTPNAFEVFPDNDVHYCLKRTDESSGGAGSIMLLSDNKRYYDLSVLDEYAKTDEKIQAQMFAITKPKFHNIGFRWNCVYRKDWCLCKREDSYIIHYGGHKRLFFEKHPELEWSDKYDDLVEDFKVECCKEDLKRYG